MKIENLFLTLIKYTYIYGYEDIFENIFPTGTKRDSFGNYYIKIGNSRTLFASHLDVVGKQKRKVNYQLFDKEGHRFVKSDGETILGADDKAGVAIMIKMIENKVPGLYYFFIGEEVGHVGSDLLRRNMVNMLSNYDRCISFDRKGYGSIITRQLGKQCCSDEFATALSEEFKKVGMKFYLDAFGVSTDSVMFTGVIPECTNLSVGYFNEHTKKEEQDLDYLIELSNSILKINWEKLPTLRTPESFDTEDPEDFETELPMYKLHNISQTVDDLIYDKFKLWASNLHYFKPEKELTYFNHMDLENKKNFSLFIHGDGSITLKRRNIKLEIKDLAEFKNKLDNEIKDFVENINESIVVLKYLKLFEQFEEIDPYGEEDWSDKPRYNGNPVEFLDSLGNEEISKLLLDVFGTDDLDERMFLIDEILMIIENDYNEYYDDVEDDIRELSLA
jgi:hypothetical protein